MNAAIIRFFTPNQQASSVEKPIDESLNARIEMIRAIQERRAHDKEKPIEFEATIVLTSFRQYYERVVVLKVPRLIAQNAISIVAPSQLEDNFLDFTLDKMSVEGLELFLKRLESAKNETLKDKDKKAEEDKKLKKESVLIALVTNKSERCKGKELEGFFEDKLAPFLGLVSLLRLRRICVQLVQISYSNKIWGRVFDKELKGGIIPKKFLDVSAVNPEYLLEAVKEEFIKKKSPFMAAFAPFFKTYNVKGGETLGLDPGFMWELPKIVFQDNKVLSKNDLLLLPPLFTFTTPSFYGLGIKKVTSTEKILNKVSFDLFVCDKANGKWKLWKFIEGNKSGIGSKEFFTDEDFEYLIRLITGQDCGVNVVNEGLRSYGGKSQAYIPSMQLIQELAETNT